MRCAERQVLPTSQADGKPIKRAEVRLAGAAAHAQQHHVAQA